MPKSKTSSSVKKRFKVTAGGKLLRRRAPKSHNLTKKSPKRKRGFRKDTPVHGVDRKEVLQMFGGKGKR